MILELPREVKEELRPFGHQRKHFSPEAIGRECPVRQPGRNYGEPWPTGQGIPGALRSAYSRAATPSKSPDEQDPQLALPVLASRS